MIAQSPFAATSATRKGILILMLGIGLFTTMDALAKGLLQHYPTPQVIWARFIGQSVLVTLILGPRKFFTTLRSPYPWTHLARSSCQLGATGFFFFSLGYIGLAEATALADLNPVLISLGAALFLGERLGTRRVIAVIVALCGALIITRPGAGIFSAAALLPLGCAISYAGAALLTRKVGQKEGPSTAMLHAAVFGAVVTSLFLPFTWQPIALIDLPRFVALGVLGTAAQFCLIKAFSMAEASAIAPFSYLGIVFATLWGIVLYAEYPDQWTLIGALVIAASGLYVWAQETPENQSRPMSETQFQPKAFAQNLVVRGVIGLALLVPYRWRVPLMGRLMRGVIGHLAGYRSRAMANLALIWPNMTFAQHIHITSEALDNAGRTLIENYSTKQFTARQSAINPQGPGVAALAQAQAEGRPVILVSGHFGNYEAARACLVARGYTIGGLYRPMSNPYFNAHYKRTMEAFGGPIFAQGRAGTAGFVKHLKSGGLLVLLFDQRAGSDYINFLGHPAATALSAAELALRYNADLIPFYGTRQADGLSFAVDLEPPILHSTALQMTESLTRSLEARVNANPGQWFWIHRRWL